MAIFECVHAAVQFGVPQLRRRRSWREGILSVSATLGRYNSQVVNRSNVTLRKFELGSEPAENELDRSPAERIALVWEVTRNAWAFASRSLDEPRLRRDIARVIRSRR